jgi:hypothetical protein
MLTLIARNPTGLRHRTSRLLVAALLLAIAPVLTTCTIQPATREQPTYPPTLLVKESWTYADLRLLDPVDATQVENDLLAVYLRRPVGESSNLLDIRLDFLELSMRNQPEIYIALDYAFGGSYQLPLPATAGLEWEALLHIPPVGRFEAVDNFNQPMNGLSAIILRDPQLDSLDIRLDASALYASPGSAAPPELKLQVFITSAGTAALVDQTDVIRSFTSPPQPARLLLAFWNTYPAYTPAQALRRWDGAHTGPLGGRHGLSNLLRAASGSDMPLVLVDLKYPAWLSALDYAGDLERVNDMASRGTLLLPEVIPPVEDPAWYSYSQHLARRFNLPGSRFAYTQSTRFIPTGASFVFYPVALPDPVTSITLQGGQRLLPLPAEALPQVALQPDLSGLSLTARRWLVDTAVRSDTAQFTVLGGDLTRSTWGNPQIARAAFHYIRTHPWIRPLYASELLSMPASPLYPDVAGSDESLFAGLPALNLSRDLPPASNTGVIQPLNTLGEAAAQAYLSLAPPATPAFPEYTALQEIYTRQIAVLQAAERWSQQPAALADCDQDIDQDSLMECVLASSNIYTVFDPELGILTHAFAIDASGVHQLIAPSSQFTFGTGDPSTWQAALGQAADPQVIPGAFYDGGRPYQADISNSQLTLSDPTSGIVKRFSLLADGIRVEYEAPAPLTTHLSLALDPWQRFAPAWGERYHGADIPYGLAWSLSPELAVEITTNARLTLHAFTDTQNLMGLVENPNAELPPGHYLPFPMAVFQIYGSPDFWIVITISPWNR